MSFFESGSHYYSCANGTIEAAYDAGLREARARNLYVSPTTVAYVRSNPGLDIWKQSLLVETVLNNPQLHSESIDDYKARIKELVKKPATTAADFGTQLHDMLEHYPQMPLDASLIPWFEQYDAWYQANVSQTISNETMLAHHGIGVAGKTDLICVLRDGRRACVDFKSQNVKPGKKVTFYPSWAWQLSFYAEADRLTNSLPERPVCINLGIDSNKPSPPVAKEWSAEEILVAWRTFVTHAWLWSSDKNHWPVGQWQIPEYWNY